MRNPWAKSTLAVYTALFILFLYGPFFVLGILSFQTGPEGGPQFPIIEWSTYWYRQIFGMTPPSRVAPLPIGDALIRSLSLAFMTTVVSTVFGVLSAQAFRNRFRGSGLIFYLIILGMMVPGLPTQGLPRYQNAYLSGFITFSMFVVGE